MKHLSGKIQLMRRRAKQDQFSSIAEKKEKKHSGVSSFSGSPAMTSRTYTIRSSERSAKRATKSPRRITRHLEAWHQNILKVECPAVIDRNIEE